jgi:hypothetical protein
MGHRTPADASGSAKKALGSMQRDLPFRLSIAEFPVFTEVLTGGQTPPRRESPRFRAARTAFPGPVLPGGRSIIKNLLQLIRPRPVVRVGLVHDRNASEVSESSPDKRSGTTAPTSKASSAV